MSEPACRSEVARLMRQISEANEAAYQALYGLAQGTAQHAFITARMERMGEYHEQLVELVGEHEAALLVCCVLDGDRAVSRDLLCDITSCHNVG